MISVTNEAEEHDRGDWRQYVSKIEYFDRGTVSLDGKTSMKQPSLKAVKSGSCRSCEGSHDEAKAMRVNMDLSEQIGGRLGEVASKA